MPFPTVIVIVRRQCLLRPRRLSSGGIPPATLTRASLIYRVCSEDSAVQIYLGTYCIIGIIIINGIIIIRQGLLFDSSDSCVIRANASGCGIPRGFPIGNAPRPRPGPVRTSSINTQVVSPCFTDPKLDPNPKPQTPSRRKCPNVRGDDDAPSTASLRTSRRGGAWAQGRSAGLDPASSCPCSSMSGRPTISFARVYAVVKVPGRDGIRNAPFEPTGPAPSRPRTIAVPLAAVVPLDRGHPSSATVAELAPILAPFVHDNRFGNRNAPIDGTRLWIESASLVITSAHGNDDQPGKTDPADHGTLPSQFPFRHLANVKFEMCVCVCVCVCVCIFLESHAEANPRAALLVRTERLCISEPQLHARVHRPRVRS
jgi:hypothetical protein